MGKLIERQAEELEERSKASAAPAFLRAFTGYRAAAFLMNPKDDFERFSETVESFVRCFRKAIPSFDNPCEPVRVPFEDNYLSGYFYRVDEQSVPRPTVIIVGGGDTFAEDLHFWAGAAGPRRSYNVLSVELPGYGMSPTRNLYLRADTEAPLGAAVEYALGRPEVEASGLAAYGISGGDCQCSSDLWARGTPLGLMPRMSYEENETSLERGESILFYSDGFVEAHNPHREMFGFPRLRDLADEYGSDGGSLVERLLNELSGFVGAGSEQEDDITLVVLQRLTT
jgi:hypothetical protein